MSPKVGEAGSHEHTPACAPLELDLASDDYGLPMMRGRCGWLTEPAPIMRAKELGLPMGFGSVRVLPEVTVITHGGTHD